MPRSGDERVSTFPGCLREALVEPALNVLGGLDGLGGLGSDPATGSKTARYPRQAVQSTQERLGNYSAADQTNDIASIIACFLFKPLNCEKKGALAKNSSTMWMWTWETNSSETSKTCSAPSTAQPRRGKPLPTLDTRVEINLFPQRTFLTPRTPHSAREVSPLTVHTVNRDCDDDSGLPLTLRPYCWRCPVEALKRLKLQMRASRNFLHPFTLRAVLGLAEQTSQDFKI
ncbi:hypothetical protein FPQ18DRAFT_311370 [Pyronema domesticum]|nr:hypothetical protein FPQ18DRAFT_311370 [Pyronema domesticum]